MAMEERSSALRYGAPAAVVDPILSFLFDLRRMEDTMLSALEHLGVQRCCLPPPFGQRERDRSSLLVNGSTTTSGSGDGAAECHAGPAAAPAASFFDAYVKSAVAGQTDPTMAESYEAVQHILAWLDGQQSAQSSSSSSPSAPMTSSPSVSRALVAAFVAAGDQHDAFLKDPATAAETHVRRPLKRRKRDSANKSLSTTACAASPRPVASAVTAAGQKDEQPADGCRLLSLSAAEVRAAANLCRHYEKLLKGSTRELSSTIRAVTTSDLAASYSCHAKWVEVAREDVKLRCVFPASKVLKENYELLIRFNDALATCQAAVHGAYMTLEETVDVFLEEALVVAREERAFQSCVTAARGECQGMQEVRRRLKRTRQALETAISLDA